MDNADLRARVEQVVEETRTNFTLREKKLKTLLKEAERGEDIFVIGRINLLLAACYFTQGKRSGLLPHAVKAVDIFEKLENRNLLASSLNVLAISYAAQGNYARALELYNRTLLTIRGLKKPFLRRDVALSNIAESYYCLGEYQKSAHLMKQCIDTIRKKHPDDHVSAVIYSINLSDNYECMEEYEQALDILEKAKPDSEIIDLQVLVWGYYFRRCCVLYKLGNVEEAVKYADLGIDGVKQGYDSYEFHRDLEKIAKEQIKLGDYARAQILADILTEYADKNKHTIDLIVSKRVQARICQARGERDRALELYRELNILYERRMSENREMQYESHINAENASKEIGKLLQRIQISKERAQRDPLTGLKNRSALVSVTNEFIDSAKEKGRTIGAVFMDIDYFKEFNDTYGHAAGDEAIKYVAHVCLDEETATVKFFRYGGDEYFGIVYGYRDEELEQLALRISQKVRASGFQHIKNPNGQMLTVSIGIVNLNMQDSEHTILDIINYADRTLYQAKEHGRNAVFSFCSVRDPKLAFKQIWDREK